jgi:hypothetical protein
MGPLLMVDPDMATPLKKWLAKILKGVLPSFCIGALDAANITRDKDHVKKVSSGHFLSLALNCFILSGKLNIT